MVDKINERWVLVVGCDSGFGKELCIKLDEMRAKVFACCLTEEGTSCLRSICSTNVRPLVMDVREKSSVEEGFKFIKKSLGPGKGLWSIVYNAGLSGNLGPFLWLNKKDFLDVFHTNFFGAIEVFVPFLPLLKSLKPDEKTRIVIMTSILSSFQIPYASAYCTSKAALEAFASSLNFELTNFESQVITIQPGAHVTNFITKGDESFCLSWQRLEKKQKFFGVKYFEHITFVWRFYLKLFGRTSLSKVTSCYTSAIFSKHPNDHYLVGWDAQILSLLSWLPKSWLKQLLQMFSFFPRPLNPSLFES